MFRAVFCWLFLAEGQPSRPTPEFCVWVWLLRRAERTETVTRSGSIRVGVPAVLLRWRSCVDVWDEGNAGEIMPNAQTHQVIACELLAGQAIACFIIHLPGPGQILVSDAFLAEMAVGLASGQDIPDQFQQTPSHGHDRLVAVHAFLHLLEPVFPAVDRTSPPAGPLPPLPNAALCALPW